MRGGRPRRLGTGGGSGVGARALVSALAVVVVLSPSEAHAQTPPGADTRSSAGAAAGVEVAAFLVGCWVTRGEGRRTDEVWIAPEGGLMVGVARSVRDGRATGWEHLLLGVRDGALTYTAFPSGQAPNEFRLTGRDGGFLRFEDPGHDFPQALEYHQVGPDSLQAKVFSDVGDAEPAFVLRYAREACP